MSELERGTETGSRRAKRSGPRLPCRSTRSVTAGPSGGDDRRGRGRRARRTQAGQSRSGPAVRDGQGDGRQAHGGRGRSGWADGPSGPLAWLVDAGQHSAIVTTTVPP